MTCPYCGEEFNDIFLLDHHIETEHIDEHLRMMN